MGGQCVSGLASGTTSTYPVLGAVTGVVDVAPPNRARRVGTYVFPRTGDPNAKDAGGVTADPEGYGASNPGVTDSALDLCCCSRAVHVGGIGGIPGGGRGVMPGGQMGGMPGGGRGRLGGIGRPLGGVMNPGGGRAMPGGGNMPGGGGINPGGGGGGSPV